MTDGNDDWELVERARTGDTGAFEALVRRYQGPVVHFCRRMVGPQDAEDVAQDCFVRLYRHLWRLTPRARFSTVLFGIARNLALNALRDAARRDRGRASHSPGPAGVEAVPQDERLRPDVVARGRELGGLLEQALERLSPEHREVLVLREMQGLDYDAIAKVVRCRQGTVKSRLARARESLRARLTELGGDLLP